MSGEEKIQPFVSATLFDVAVKIEYTMQSAIIFKRLTGVNFLGGFDIDNAEHVVAFIISGLVKHQPELVGEIDATGVPNDTMSNLSNRILDSVPMHALGVATFCVPFYNALALGKPKPKTDEAKDSKKKPRKNGTS